MKPYGIALVAVGGIMILSCIMPVFLGLLNYSGAYFTFAFVVLTMVLSYGLVSLVPVIFLAAKQGWKAGISVVAYEVIWMAAIVLLIAWLFPSSPEMMY